MLLVKIKFSVNVTKWKKCIHKQIGKYCEIKDMDFWRWK